MKKILSTALISLSLIGCGSDSDSSKTEKPPMIEFNNLEIATSMSQLNSGTSNSKNQTIAPLVGFDISGFEHDITNVRVQEYHPLQTGIYI